MLLDDLQELQWHNSQYMKLYTYATHATMLQLNHCNYYAITLWLLCHYIVTSMIKVHHLTGSFSTVPGGYSYTKKLWHELFRDLSHCWDRKSEKVSEHQTCRSSHANGAIPLVGVNLFSLCWLLLSYPNLN